tara:strand:- start:596 stop:799 length:204 start_codon:yes stop_codon:yes gene_type:complete
MRDFIEVIILICYIKLRWWYFHLHPWYCKFSIEGDEYYFQNTKTGVIHSQIMIKFNEDSLFYKEQGK